MSETEIEIYRSAETNPRIWNPVSAFLLCSRYHAVRAGNRAGAALAYGNTIRAVTRRARRKLRRLDQSGDATPVRRVNV